MPKKTGFSPPQCDTDGLSENSPSVLLGMKALSDMAKKRLAISFMDKKPYKEYGKPNLHGDELERA